MRLRFYAGGGATTTCVFVCIVCGGCVRVILTSFPRRSRNSSYRSTDDPPTKTASPPEAGQRIAMRRTDETNAQTNEPRLPKPAPNSRPPASTTTTERIGGDLSGLCLFINTHARGGGENCNAANCTCEWFCFVYIRREGAVAALPTGCGTPSILAKPAYVGN